MQLSRGLALMLTAFGGLFAALGPWLSTPHGPANSSFEAIRRYDAALGHGQVQIAAALGAQSVALARVDKRWSASELAALEARVAEAQLAAGHAADALKFARSATAQLDTVRDAGVTLLIQIARTHGDLALAAGERLEAACTYGLLLERLGPDRVAHPELRLHPHPALEALTLHLASIGKQFSSGAIPAAKPASALPLTSCNLVADFYAERRDFKSAAAVSEIVLNQVQSDPAIGPEIKASLLQDAARISELNGNVATAKSRLNAAIQTLQDDAQKPALVVALEALATVHSNWSDAKGAQPILERAISLREQLYGTRHLSLVSPLLALGYAQLDTGKPTDAEATLRRALDIAESQSGRNPAAALEATLALTELYQSEGRTEEANALRAKSSAMQRSGVALRPADVEDVPIVVPTAGARLAVLQIPFRSGQTAGHIAVALTAPSATAWTAAWPKANFVRASEGFAEPLIYEPKLSAPGDADPTIGATLVFVPGQGTTLASNAGRLARLQAMIGPTEVPVLVDWASDALTRDGLRVAATERAGKLELERVLAGIPAGQQPLTFIAEGRGALILATALQELSAQQRQAINARLAQLILIAPDLPDALLKQWLAGLDKKRVQTVIYPAKTARPLLIAKEIYGESPIGLDPARVSKLGAETVEIGVGSDWADFSALSSDALIADIAAAVATNTPAAKRCGLARMTAAGAADTYVLNPQGCAPAKAK